MTDQLLAAWHEFTALARDAVAEVLREPHGQAKIEKIRKAVRFQKEALALLDKWRVANDERHAQAVYLQAGLNRDAELR